MATDATGTPTSPDSIPKYNTAVDAPSGLGFNAAMDAIQVALSARVGKPSGIVSGEVPVWNGTGWDRSSVTKVGTGSLSGYPWTNSDIAAGAAIAASKLAGYPTDGTKALFGDGNWKAVSGAQVDRKTTQKDVVNTTVETDLLNGEIDIPANALGANGVAYLDVEGDWLNNSGSTPTFTWRLKIGATTVWASTTPALSSSANRGPWLMRVTIANANATNSQQIAGMIHQVARAGNQGTTSGTGGLSNGTENGISVIGGTAAEDTTALKNIAFTVQWSAANANNSMRVTRAILTMFNIA